MKLLLDDLSSVPQNPHGVRGGRGDLKSQGFYHRMREGDWVRRIPKALWKLA